MKKTFRSLFSVAGVATALFIVAILLTSGGDSHGAYLAPTGIPVPPFGIDEVAPAQPLQWPTAEVPGFYYVDNSHPYATDTGNLYGYPNKPRLTIPTSYTAGAYVEVHGGPYTGGQLIITANGTKEKPVWIRGTSGANAPSIQKETIVKGSYIIIEFLAFNGAPNNILSLRPHSGSTVNNVGVRNCTFTGTANSTGSTSAMGIYGDTYNNVYNIVAYNNIVRNYGDFGTISSVEQDFHAFAPSSYCDNIWILNNAAYDITGDGIQVGAATISDPKGVPHHIYVGGNTFYHTGENAIDIKKSSDVIVSSNTGYNFTASSHDPGAAIVIHNSPSWVWIINNIMHDAPIGIITTGSENTYFIGNLVYNISTNGIESRGSSLLFVLNNTVYNSQTGINANSSQHVKNNIITTVNTSQYHVIAGNTSVAAASTLDNDIFYQPGGSSRILWGDGVVRNISGVQSAFNICRGCFDSDPLFADTRVNNFRLTSSSPAVDQGILADANQVFQNKYGLPILRDIDGTLRPQGNASDIGAYESMWTSGIIRTPKPITNIIVR